MTLFNGGTPPAQSLSQVQAKLANLRSALEIVADLRAWAAGVAAADLVAAWSMSTADAGTLLAAINDAGALSDIYTTGKPPSTYPQPIGAVYYIYAAAQRQVIGVL